MQERGGVPADILAREPTERGGGEARARQRVVVGWTPPNPVAALILLLRPKQPKGLSLGVEKKNCEKSGVCPLQLAFNLKGNQNKSIERVVLKVPCQPPFVLKHCQGVRYYFLIQETMQATADISLVLSVTQAKHSSLVFAQEHAGKILFAKKE